MLGKEQADDDEEKEYCEAELDFAEDKLKELEHTIANLEKDIANGEGEQWRELLVARDAQGVRFPGWCYEDAWCVRGQNWWY